jgi:hypothetical protein
MPFTAEDIKRAKVRSKARKFAAEVRESNMACTVPDDIIDSLADDEVKMFTEFCKQFRIVQRKDFYWERAE